MDLRTKIRLILDCVNMWQTSVEHNRPLRRLSFAGAVQRFDVVAPYLYLFCGTSKAVIVYKLL